MGQKKKPKKGKAETFVSIDQIYRRFLPRHFEERQERGANGCCPECGRPYESPFKLDKLE